VSAGNWERVCETEKCTSNARGIAQLDDVLALWGLRAVGLVLSPPSFKILHYTSHSGASWHQELQT